jgi:hypothetical protein
LLKDNDLVALGQRRTTSNPSKSYLRILVLREGRKRMGCVGRPPKLLAVPKHHRSNLPLQIFRSILWSFVNASVSEMYSTADYPSNGEA